MDIRNKLDLSYYIYTQVFAVWLLEITIMIWRIGSFFLLLDALLRINQDIYLDCSPWFYGWINIYIIPSRKWSVHFIIEWMYFLYMFIFVCLFWLKKNSWTFVLQFSQYIFVFSVDLRCITNQIRTGKSDCFVLQFQKMFCLVLFRYA